MLKRTVLVLSLVLVGSMARADLIEWPLAEGVSLAELPSGSALIEFSREPALTDFPDPRCPAVGAVQIRTDRQSIDIPLDCSKWTLDLKHGIYQYSNPTASNGEVSNIEWRSVSLIIEIATRTSILMAPVQYVESRLTIDSTAYCAHFDQFSVNGNGVIAGDTNAPCTRFHTPTPTPTNTPTATSTPTITRTFTSTRTQTPTRTWTPTKTITPGGPTLTPTETSTETPTITKTPTRTATGTITMTPTITGTPTPTPTATPQPPKAFRFRSLAIADPPFSVTSGTSCLVITTIVNSLVSNAVGSDGTDVDSYLDLSALAIFRPLNQAGAGGNMSLAFADCLGPVGSESCVPGSVSQDTAYTNQASGTCLAPVPGTNTNAVTSTSAPCFVTSTISQTFSVGGIDIPLQNVRMAGTYSGNPATALTSGLLVGFLDEASANSIVLPADLPLVGGSHLSALLPGGSGNCSAVSAKDTGPNGAIGWYFYLQYGANLVTYTEP